MKSANVWLGLLAMILGLVLWLHVQTQAEPSVQREYMVKLIPRELPTNLAVVRGPTQTVVIGEGSIEDLNKVRADDIVAYADLSTAQPGNRPYAVQLVGPTRSPVSLSLKNVTVRFDLAPIMRQDKLVELETVGTLPAGFQFDTASIQPDRVTVAGPASEVKSIVRVRAILNLSKIQKAGDSYLANVEVLGAQNKPLSLVTTDPPEVTILPAVAAAPQSKNLIIAPNWLGEPAFGYEVIRYELRPNQLEVTGESSLLAGLSRLETEPINLENLKSTTTVFARVRLPKGVSSPQANRVRVIIVVEKSKSPTESVQPTNP